jgi:hypothetical protein
MARLSEVMASVASLSPVLVSVTVALRLLKMLSNAN